jgi:hypothetical protein
MRWRSCRQKQREIETEKARELEQGGGEDGTAGGKKDRHKINLRKGTVEETLVE